MVRYAKKEKKTWSKFIYGISQKIKFERSKFLTTQILFFGVKQAALHHGYNALLVNDIQVFADSSG